MCELTSQVKNTDMIIQMIKSVKNTVNKKKKNKLGMKKHSDN